VRVADAQPYCKPELMQDIVRSIAALHADQVVLISQWDLFMRGFSIKGPLSVLTHFLMDSPIDSPVDGSMKGDEEHASTETSQVALQRELPVTVTQLRAAGADVLILKAPPILNETVFSGYVRHTDTFEPSLAQHRKNTEFTSTLIDSVVDHSHVKSFDVAARWCNKEKCVAIENGLLVYGDDNHLTATASLSSKKDLQTLVIDPAQGQH